MRNASVLIAHGILTLLVVALSACAVEPAPVPTQTATPTAASTPTSAPTLGPTATSTPIATQTGAPLPTPAPNPTPTATATPNTTPVPTPAPTPVPAPTPTPTPTPAPTSIPTPVPTPTPASTTTPTPTPTPSPTPTPTLTPTAIPEPVEPLPKALSMNQQLFMGYQGWFACPGDGSPIDGWVHWFVAETRNPNAVNVTVDMWPDTSEMKTEDLCATPFTLPDGSPAYLYSNFNQNVVLKHFQWMEEYGINGVFFQRFLAPLRDRRYVGLLNQSIGNVRVSAEAYGRTFAVMYDVSGHDEATLVEDL